jgi:hypothetical protein
MERGMQARGITGVLLTVLIFWMSLATERMSTVACIWRSLICLA